MIVWLNSVVAAALRGAGRARASGRRSDQTAIFSIASLGTNDAEEALIGSQTPCAFAIVFPRHSLSVKDRQCTSSYTQAYGAQSKRADKLSTCQPSSSNWWR